MVYPKVDKFLFEFERSVNKDNFISYDASSMAHYCEPLDDLTSELFIQCKISDLILAKGSKTRANAEARLRQDLRSILWNMLRAFRFDRDCYVLMSFSTHAFSRDPEKNPFGISRSLTQVIRLLSDGGWVNFHVGYDFGVKELARLTRVRASVELIKKFALLPRKLTSVTIARPAIEFRDATTDKKRVVNRPSQNPKFDEIENLLERQNELLAKHSIVLGPIPREFLQWQDSSKKKKWHTTDLTDKSLKAIFHVDADNSVSYGRMHGGFWQHMPSRFRTQIVIDGMPVVELDYSAQVLSMAASHSKVQLIGDPYSVDLGLGKLGSKIQREIVKSCIVVLINTNSEDEAINGLRFKVKKGKYLNGSGVILNKKTIQNFFDDIFDHHPFLKKYAFQGLGKGFFYHDSEIARSVIRVFVDLDKVVLPIHDGFVVADEDCELLDQTMKNAWCEKFGTTIGIKME